MLSTDYPRWKVNKFPLHVRKRLTLHVRGTSSSVRPVGSRLHRRWTSGLAAVDHAGSGFLHRAVDEALRLHGRPEIFNTDQANQFASDAFTELLKGNGIDISMDGKGLWRDNVFIERFWRTVKYEEMYTSEHTAAWQRHASIGRYVQFYNGLRPHSALDRHTSDQSLLQLAAWQPNASSASQLAS